MSDEHGPFAQGGPEDRASMARDAEAAFERGFVAGWEARGRAEDAAILRAFRREESVAAQQTEAAQLATAAQKPGSSLPFCLRCHSVKVDGMPCTTVDCPMR